MRQIDLMPVEVELQSVVSDCSQLHIHQHALSHATSSQNRVLRILYINIRLIQADYTYRLIPKVQIAHILVHPHANVIDSDSCKYD